MKSLATRIQTLKSSPTLAISAKAMELKKQGRDIISFSAGEPDFETPTNIKQAGIAAIQAGKTRYTQAAGMPELKDAIIHKLKVDNNLDYTREEVIASNGGKHALFNIALALFEDGDEVIIPAPYWVSYPDQIMLCGAKPVILNTSDKEGFKISPNKLSDVITPKTKALILNTPSNPTGATYTRDELSKIAEVCLKNDLYIISDEIYEHIVYDGVQHVSPASLGPEIKAKTIIVNGVSKSHAMTGWRMGFAAGPAPIIKTLNMIQEQTTSNICTITQMACVEAYRGPQESVKTMVTAFEERRNAMVSALNKIPGITCTTPTGAFYAFPNISQILNSKKFKEKSMTTSEAFCLYLLESQNVAAVPGSAFGAEGYIRLSYATDMESIREGMARLARVIL